MIILDIETRANFTREELDALLPMPPVEAPANYKKPESIARYIEEETEKRAAIRHRRAALDPDLGRVSSVGLLIPGRAEGCGPTF